MKSATDRAALALAAAFLVLALNGLGATDIVGDDEAREVGIVQDIVAGHWLWPRFNADLLPDKPLLYHWLAAVPASAGFSETAVRLPSALAGAALVGWTARFGAEIVGPRAGLAAALLLATTPALLTRARVARPDVLLVFLLAAALGLAFRWWRDARPRDATLALTLLGLATLAKGPVAPVLFALTFTTFLVWQGDLARLPRLLTAPGVVAFAVLGLGWYVLALAGWGETFVREHLLGRYLRNLAGGLPAGEPYSPRSLAFHLFFYPKHLPAIALPWTPLTVLALWQAARTGGFRDPRVRFLVCWAAAPVIAFTPAEWKLRYYLLPSLPALALLTAPTLMALWRTPARWPTKRRILIVGAAALLVLGVVAATVVLHGIHLSRSDTGTLEALLPLVPGGARGAAAAGGFVAGALLVAIATRAWAALIAGVTAGALAWMAAGTPALERAVSARDSLKPFAAEVATRYPPPAALAFYGEPIRAIVVYVGRSITPVGSAAAIAPGVGVITSGRAYRSLAAARVLGPPLLVREGRMGNLARGRVVLAEGLAERSSVVASLSRN